MYNMDIDGFIDQLVGQAYDEVRSSLKAPAIKPVNIKQINNTIDADNKKFTEIQQPVELSIPAQQTGKRLSRAEREQQGIEQYQSEKNEANTNLLMTGLAGAGLAAAVGILGKNRIRRGSDLAKQYLETVETKQGYRGAYYNPRPSFFDPRFWTGSLDDQTLKQEHRGRLKEIYSDPLKLFGAAAYRLGVDGATDATRSYGWRYNHPLAGIGDAIKASIDPMQALNVTDRYGVYFATAMPAIAAGGLAYDITNPAELFRPKGFKQLNPNPENPRESTEPAVELFQRFAMGRSSRPLKYSEAKKDIPDLEYERYKNYARFAYQDKGPLGLGLIKFTDENLQGQPELRMLGYPVNIPTLTTAALGALGARIATTQSEQQYRKGVKEQVEKMMDVKPARVGFTYNTPGEKSKRKNILDIKDLPDVADPKVIKSYIGKKNRTLERRQLMGALGGVAIGATAGAFLGNFVNNMIASSKNNPETLPDTKEYGIS